MDLALQIFEAIPRAQAQTLHLVTALESTLSELVEAACGFFRPVDKDIRMLNVGCLT